MSWALAFTDRYNRRASRFLRLHALKAAAGETLGVVADQVGCPTSTPTLAAACWRAISTEGPRILHWSDAGAASWYDFAVAIGELGVAAGLLDGGRTLACLRIEPSIIGHELAEAQDGVHRRAQLVTHVGQEKTFQSTALFCFFLSNK